MQLGQNRLMGRTMQVNLDTANGSKPAWFTQLGDQGLKKLKGELRTIGTGRSRQFLDAIEGYQGRMGEYDRNSEQTAKHANFILENLDSIQSNTNWDAAVANAIANSNRTGITAEERDTLNRRRMNYLRYGKFHEYDSENAPKVPFPPSVGPTSVGDRVIKDDNLLRVNGKTYKLGIGAGGTMGVFVMQDTPKWWERFSLKKIREQRELDDSTYFIKPPRILRKFHFNYGENFQLKNMTEQQAYNTTRSNLSKVLGDSAALSMLEQVANEGQLKRFWHHLLPHSDVVVSGRLLSEAIKYNAGEYGRNAYGEPPNDEYTANAKVKVNELAYGEQIAIVRYMISNGLPHAQFQMGRRTDPVRYQEYDQKLAADKVKVFLESNPGLANRRNPAAIADAIRTIAGLNDIAERQDFDSIVQEVINNPEPMSEDAKKNIQRSMSTDVDWQGAAENVFKQRAMYAPEYTRQMPRLVVNSDGTLDTGEIVTSEDGTQKVKMKTGARPFTIPRWNIPTIAPIAETYFVRLIKNDEFLDFITDMGKRMDVTLEQLFTIARQPIKGWIMNAYHKGIIDAHEDLAVKFGGATSLTPEESTAISLQIHEITTHMDGERLDHMRRAMGDMLRNMDDDVKVQYFASENIDEENRRYQTAWQTRGRFLYSLASQKNIISLMHRAQDALNKDNFEAYDKYRKEYIRLVQDKYSTTINASIVHEREGPPEVSRRAMNIADFLYNNLEIFEFMLHTPGVMAKEKNPKFGGWSLDDSVAA
jgi:hypothetical protein